jgi:hypothetical protein
VTLPVVMKGRGARWLNGRFWRKLRRQRDTCPIRAFEKFATRHNDIIPRLMMTFTNPRPIMTHECLTTNMHSSDLPTKNLADRFLCRVLPSILVEYLD